MKKPINNNMTSCKRIAGLHLIVTSANERSLMRYMIYGKMVKSPSNPDPHQMRSWLFFHFFFSSSLFAKDRKISRWLIHKEFMVLRHRPAKIRDYTFLSLKPERHRSMTLRAKADLPKKLT